MEGFVMALDVMKWHEYVRDDSDFADGKGGCYNDGPKNGYDLGVLVRKYMASKGKRHLSFVEAVLEGEVEELLPLQKEVGRTDGFFSQVGVAAAAAGSVVGRPRDESIMSAVVSV